MSNAKPGRSTFRSERRKVQLARALCGGESGKLRALDVDEASLVRGRSVQADQHVVEGLTCSPSPGACRVRRLMRRGSSCVRCCVRCEASAASGLTRALRWHSATVGSTECAPSLWRMPRMQTPVSMFSFR